jgi:hypothetical protein
MFQAILLGECIEPVDDFQHSHNLLEGIVLDWSDGVDERVECCDGAYGDGLGEVRPGTERVQYAYDN